MQGRKDISNMDIKTKNQKADEWRRLFPNIPNIVDVVVVNIPCIETVLQSAAKRNVYTTIPAKFLVSIFITSLCLNIASCFCLFKPLPILHLNMFIMQIITLTVCKLFTNCSTICRQNRILNISTSCKQENINIILGKA